MQTSIRAAEKGKHIDKLRPCARCERKPKVGEKRFLVCSGCKTTVYCSQSCQKAAWKSHKPQCEDRQRSDLATAMQDAAHASAQALLRELLPGVNIPDPIPPHGQRVRLFHHFRHSHMWSFQRAVYYAVLMQGGLKQFDFDTQCILFDVRYRPECGGNPSLAYSVLDVNITALDDLLVELPSLQTVMAANKPALDDTRLHRSKNNPNFSGFLASIYRWAEFGGYFISHPTPLYCDPGIEIRAPYMRACHEWKEDLQKATEAGIVYQSLEEHGRFKAGSMKMERSKWRWNEFTSDELVKNGFPADFPGYLC